MKTKTRITLMLGLIFAGVLCLGAAIQAEQHDRSSKKQWDKRNAIVAFDAALTRSGYDRVFRNRLTASVKSARQAVSEEGQVTIPENVIIMTHEDSLSGNYHVFDLPPFNENAHVAEEYHVHLGCC